MGVPDPPAGDGVHDPLDEGAEHRADDVADLPPRGFAPSAGVRVLRAVRVPGTLLLLGVVLLFVGPVPGLAAFLVIGAGLATFVIGMTALVGR
jgi:hypothetical protein